MNDGGFVSITTGTCASHGYGVITTAAECEAAAVALGWSDVVVDSGSTWSWSDYPPGCLDNYGTLYYNTLLTSTVSCGDNTIFTCACKTSLVAAVAASAAAAQVRGFDSVTTGTCASHGYGVITTAAECEAAAVALGWSDVVVDHAYSSNHPHGCYFHTIGVGSLGFNTLTTSTVSCSSTNECPCQTPSLVAAVAANSAALNDGGLGSLTTGTCASHGYGVITTAAECEAAAVALGWSDVDASGNTGSMSSWPPGCSLYSGILRYNTLTTSTVSCSSTRKCACQTPSLVAATAANTAAIGANSAAVAANSAAILSGLYSIDTGTCASHGYGVITTAAECEAAAVALGWSDVVVDSGDTVSSGGWPPGCSQYSSGTLLYNTLTTSTASCSSTYKCACQTPSLVAATADNSAAITANSAALNDGGFVSITTGTCASHGYGVITTAAECNQAAATLGFSDRYVDSGHTFSYSHAPPGCYLYDGGHLCYNTLTTSTASCSSTYKCACSITCPPPSPPIPPPPPIIPSLSLPIPPP